MSGRLRIDECTEVHVSRKSLSSSGQLEVTAADGFDTIQQIYLGNGIIMHLMHDWWSAFILIANSSKIRR